MWNATHHPGWRSLPSRGLLSYQARLAWWVPEPNLGGEDRHRQNDITIFAPVVNVPKNIVSDVPDEVCEPVQLRLIHVGPIPRRSNLVITRRE